jgi:hypothetical protein
MDIIMNATDIKFICRKHSIVAYTINNDLSVDVRGDVDLYEKNLTELPLQFNKVSGNFYCSKNNLTTLKGCPSYVRRDFMCGSNYPLKSLEYCPKHIGGDFYCGFLNLKQRQTLYNTSVGGQIVCASNITHILWKF